MKEEKMLFKDKWVSIIEKTIKNGGKYLYSKADWCNSQGVAILPFAFKDEQLKLLGRFEVCPAHSDELELCSITGGMDKEGENALVTAWRELIEEGGYKVKQEDIIYLGSVRPSKASDMTTHLFSVPMNDESRFEVVEATGDGTAGEEGAYCDWITEEQLILSKDPLLHAMYVRMMKYGTDYQPYEKKY